VVTYAWKVFNTTTTNKHYRVLLEVVTFATYVGYHFEFVGKANLSHFAKGRVWFFRSGGINLCTYPSALWARF
jgi:hypothetical protein